MITRKYCFKIIILTLLLIVISAFKSQNVFALATVTGNILEEITSTDHLPIKDVCVTITNQNNPSIVYSTLTDEVGNYCFNDIPAGEYKIEFRYGDVQKVREEKARDLSKEEIENVLKYNGHDYIISEMGGKKEERTESTTRQKTSKNSQIIFVIDNSGSMRSTMSGSGKGQTRLEIVKILAKTLAELIADEDETLEMALIKFSTDASLVKDLDNDLEALKQAIDNLEYEGTTNAYAALKLADETFTNFDDKPRIVIFLSDGKPNVHEEKIDGQLEKMKNEGIHVFSLFIKVSASDKREIEEYFSKSELKYADTVSELVDIMQETIKEFITKILEEEQEEELEEQPFVVVAEDSENGLEDATRRALVNSYFEKKTFHNKMVEAGKNNLAERIFLFEAVDNANSPNITLEDINELSQYTYMTMTRSFEIKDETKMVDGVTIVIITEKYEINANLKRREDFLLEITNKAVGLKVTLSDGTVLYNKTESNSDSEDSNIDGKHIFLATLDPDIVQGALVEVEYEVTIKNNSETMACTNIELLTYIPKGLTLSYNENLLSNPLKTNGDNGWQITDKEYIRKYISHDRQDLLSRNIAIFSSDALRGFGVTAKSEYKTNFVVSAYIGDIDQISYDQLDVVEVIGYRNSKVRRLEEEKQATITTFEGKSILGKNYLSLLPGDAKEGKPDYALDSNKVILVPPTGKTYHKIIYIAYGVLAVFVMMSVYWIIRKEGNK